MTKLNTGESLRKTNRLISEFMGGKSVFDSEVRFDNKDMPGLYYKLSELKYHLSWDWLMLVVEKIESMGYEISISGNGCAIWGGTYSRPYFYVARKSKIEAAYNHIVDFIKWNNSITP